MSAFILGYQKKTKKNSNLQMWNKKMKIRILVYHARYMIEIFSPGGKRPTRIEAKFELIE